MAITGIISAILVGLVIGALLTMATTRTLQAFLYGVSPFDLPTLVLAEGALGVAALMASVIPAARALRIDPLLAMRSE